MTPNANDTDDPDWHTTTPTPSLLVLGHVTAATTAASITAAALAHLLFVDGATAETVADAAGELVASNLEIAAPTVALAAVWVLHGLLGDRLLGPDDDWWPRVRRPALRALHRLGKRRDLYAVTTTHKTEVAGRIWTDLDELERRLADAGYLRQPLSSLHETPAGQPEAGSWARPLAPWVPVEVLVRALPAVGGPLGRVLRSLDDVLALRQRNVVLHVVDTTVDGHEVIVVSGHDEPNPLNPLTAAAHYRGDGFQPAPDAVRGDLKRVGVDLAPPGDAPFAPADGGDDETADDGGVA